jgi:hypothetical protein
MIYILAFFLTILIFIGIKLLHTGVTHPHEKAMILELLIATPPPVDLRDATVYRLQHQAQCRTNPICRMNKAEIEVFINWYLHLMRCLPQHIYESVVLIAPNCHQSSMMYSVVKSWERAIADPSRVEMHDNQRCLTTDELVLVMREELELYKTVPHA